MSVARIVELSAVSEQGFEDAINQAVARATKTLRSVEGAADPAPDTLATWVGVS